MILLSDSSNCTFKQNNYACRDLSWLGRSAAMQQRCIYDAIEDGIFSRF